MAIPANALYHAINEVMIPKYPAALMALTESPSWPMVIHKKVRVMKRKREKNATVDLNVMQVMVVVKSKKPSIMKPTQLRKSSGFL